MRRRMLVDGDCGFCARMGRIVAAGPFDLEVTPLQQVDLARLGVDAQRARTDMPFVGADGSVEYGHRAWAAVLRTGPAPLRLAGRVLGAELFAAPGAAVYRLVATNRHRLPGGSGTCAV